MRWTPRSLNVETCSISNPPTAIGPDLDCNQTNLDCLTCNQTMDLQSNQSNQTKPIKRLRLRYNVLRERNLQ